MVLPVEFVNRSVFELIRIQDTNSFNIQLYIKNINYLL